MDGNVGALWSSNPDYKTEEELEKLQVIKDKRCGCNDVKVKISIKKLVEHTLL